jgi:uncharacterized lipoprotein YmbA
MSQEIRMGRVRVLCIGAAFMLSGCLGGSPRPEFYRLEATALAGPPVASLPGLGIFVGTIDLPDYLDRDEIVTSDGLHRLVPADAQRWGGSLDSDVQRVVADDLAALLGTAHVAAYPVQPRFPVAWRVLVDVRSFEGAPGGTVRLRARWVVASEDDGRAVAVEESIVEQSAASEDWEAYVAAQSAALGVVTRQIAEKIASLAAK